MTGGGYSRSIPAEGETDFSVWAHADDAAEIIGAELKRKHEEEICLEESEPQMNEAEEQSKVKDGQNTGFL